MLNIYPTISGNENLTPAEKKIESSLYPEIKQPVAPIISQQPVQPVQPTTPTTPATSTKLDAFVPEGMDADVVLLAKAIRQHESGNRAQLPGEGAEVGGASLYQYTHGTWKGVAKKYLGDENAPLTRENENKATYLRLLDWKKKGYNPAQIASMWNAGEGKPNAYAENWRGVNKWGVKYDTPAYVEKVYSTYKGLKGEYEATTGKYKTEDSELTKNIIEQERKKTGGMTPEQETELKRQIAINEKTMLKIIDDAEDVGVDKDLAKRLVERQEYEKLAELMQLSETAKTGAEKSKLTFKNVLKEMFPGQTKLIEIAKETIKMNSQAEKERQSKELEEHDRQIKLIQEIRKEKESGVDTFEKEKELADLVGTSDAKSFEETYKIQNVTNLQAIGASVMSGADLLGFGMGGTAKRTLAKGANIVAPNFVAGLVKKTGGQIVQDAWKVGKVLMKDSAVLGGVYGASYAASEGGGAKEMLMQGAIGTLAGAGFGLALGGLTSGIGAVGYNKSVQRSLKELSGEAIKATEKLNPIQKIGVKISDVYVKPQSTDLNHGYKTTNVAKYDVGGSLDKALPKVQSKLRNYTDQLNEYIKLRGDEPTLKFGNIVEELEEQYAKKENKKLGSIAGKSSELEAIKKELALKYGDDWKTKDIGFMDVIDDKRSAGIQGVWNHDPMKKITGPAEQVWNDFYSKLKVVLEKNSPKEFGQINQAITELIPIEQAYIRAMRRMDKNNVFSIYDFIGATGAFSYNPSALAIPLIHRVFKSPRVANILMKTGSIEKALGTVPTNQLAEWGIKKYGAKTYEFNGMKINTADIKPEETRSIFIKLKKYFSDRKTLPGFIKPDEFLPKKQQVIKNIQEKKGETTVGNALTTGGILSAGLAVASLIASKKGNKTEATNEPENEKEKISAKIEAGKEIEKIIPEKIKQNKIAKKAVSVFEPEDIELASRILRQENNPLSNNFGNNIKSSNRNSDGTYDEGLFQHNSNEKTDTKIPVEERVYSGTQADINKLFKEEYGRNYDIFNEDDNAKATKLWIQNIKERIKSNWDIEPDDELVMYFYHKGSRNFSLTIKNNLLDKLYNHKYITGSLDILD